MDFEGYDSQGVDPNVIFRTFFGSEDPFGGSGGMGGLGGLFGQAGGKGGMGGMFEQFGGPGNMKFTFTTNKQSK